MERPADLFDPPRLALNGEAPGQVEDPTGELFDEIVGGQAIGRRGQPEDIAEVIVYLVSPAAGFITGQTINVDGGHRMH